MTVAVRFIHPSPGLMPAQPGDGRNAMESTIAGTAWRLAGAHNLVVLTGVGVSKESGIPTFREAQDGLWAQYDPMEMASREGFLAHPRRVWEWYLYRFGRVAAARPNAGHDAIAELERLLPSVAVVTQNIDGLHQVAGSTRVHELHGSIRRYKCLSERHTGFTLADFAQQADCPALSPLRRPDSSRRRMVRGIPARASPG